MRNLPQGWTQCKAGDLFNSFSGGTPSKTKPEYWTGSIPWISSGEFNSDVITKGTEFISRAALENSSAKLCRPGSVVVVVRSGILKHTLPVALVGQEFAINQDLKCFDSGNDDLNTWLFLSLKNSAKAILKLNREGTTVQSVKYDTLKDHELSVPPLNEQRRIVAKLNKLLSRTNAAQERLATIPRILKRFRQSVLAAACSGRLSSDLHRNRLTSWSQPDSNGLPSSWRARPLASVVRVTSGEAFKKAEYSNSGLRLLQIANVSFGKIIWDQQNFLPLPYLSSHAELVLKEGDILIALNRPLLGWQIKVGRVSQSDLPAILYQRVGRFTLLKQDDPPNPAYLFIFLQSPSFVHALSNKLRGSDQPYINPPEMLEINFPEPPISEQEEIVRRVEALFKTADALEARYLKAKTYVDKLKQSILAKAFRGELVPQDPNDEPASVLLERITDGPNGSGVLKRTRARNPDQ